MFSNTRSVLCRQAFLLTRQVQPKLAQSQQLSMMHTVRVQQPLFSHNHDIFKQSKCQMTDNAGMASKILEKAKATITDELKKELNAVFIFQVSGKNYLMDAHSSRPLRVELVTELPEKVDVTLITDEDTFVKMAQGKTKATTAFMSGKLKIKGNVGVAMKAEKIFKAVKVE